MVKCNQSEQWSINRKPFGSQKSSRLISTFLISQTLLHNKCQSLIDSKICAISVSPCKLGAILISNHFQLGWESSGKIVVSGVVVNCHSLLRSLFLVGLDPAMKKKAGVISLSLGLNKQTLPFRKPGLQPLK